MSSVRWRQNESELISAYCKTDVTTKFETGAICVVDSDKSILYLSSIDTNALREPSIDFVPTVLPTTANSDVGKGTLVLKATYIDADISAG